MKNIGINVNTTKDINRSTLNFVLKSIYDRCKDANVRIFEDCRGIENEENSNLDVIIVLGGDGTILRTARCAKRFQIPLFGINIGNLGFLAEVESSETDLAIDGLFKGNYRIEERIMLESKLKSALQNKKFVALNDIVLTKGSLDTIVNYNIYVDDKFYTTFVSDGVIVSTPTGSTAYSLSAGGPIIYPNLDVIAVTPVCPHSIGIRTIVLSGKSKVDIVVKNNNDNVILNVDGQKCSQLNEAETVTINKSVYKCRLLKLDCNDYFSILRKKITYRTKECEGE